MVTLTQEKTTEKQLLELNNRIQSLETELESSAKFVALGRLVGEVSHEMNNLIYVITGYVNIIKDRLAQGEATPHSSLVSDNLADIETAALQSAQLLKELLRFSRGGATDALEQIDIYQLVAQLQTWLQPILPGQVELQLMQVDDEPMQGLVLGQATLLKQALTNLILNASDACAGQGLIQITCQRLQLPQAKTTLSGDELASGAYAYITVQDNGQGMSAETLNSIFDAYFTTKAVERGTGLGLSMVKKCIKSHRGGINCRSQLDFGTIFELYIPLITKS